MKNMELILLLGLNSILLLNVHISLAVEDTYYQVFHAVVSLEDAAYERFKDELEKVVAIQITDGSEKLDEIKITQVCSGTIKTCQCLEGFKKDESEECVPEKRVSIKGDVLFEEEKYNIAYEKPESEKFKKKKTDYEKKLSEHYSKIRWFRSLTVTKFQKGSLRVFFEIIYDGDEINTLGNVTDNMAKQENGTATLITEGFAKITDLTEIVKYKSQKTISCKLPNSNLKAEWFLLLRGKNETVIEGGTEVEVKRDLNEINITKATDVFRGLYTCRFKDLPIIHQARAFLDVSLLPEVTMYSDPQFPDCRPESTKKVIVQVTCRIQNSSEVEHYKIEWEDDDFTKENGPDYEKDQVFYTIQRTVGCSPGSNIKKHNISCTFKNRKDQCHTENLAIHPIYGDNDVCKAEGDWPAAKRNRTAILHYCPNHQIGQRKRKCNADGTWEDEMAECVNLDLAVVAGDAETLQRGIGNFTETTPKLFLDMKKSTENTNINSSANIKQSVKIFGIIRNTSEIKNTKLGSDALPDFLTSANNLLNDTLNGSWTHDTAAAYLTEVNGLLFQSNVTTDLTRKNIELKMCAGNCATQEVFGVTVEGIGSERPLLATGFKKLAEYLPQIEDEESRGIVLEVQAEGPENITLKFPEVNRTANHEMSCVVWLPNETKWSKEVCTWGGADNPGVCECTLNNNNGNLQRSQTKGYLGASFTVFMSKNPVKIPYMDYLSWIGVCVSILSLIICILIEGIVWSSVVKSNIAHFRHTAVVNISLSLLLADISFLATAFESTPTNWCWWLVVVKHYCFLAMFFWMLCLSMVLLHSLIFVFQHLSKKIFLVMSFSVGYVCPLIIVVLTYIAYENGKADRYYLPETCWLKYEGNFKGSFFAFVMPVGIIVCINILSMMVVIVRLLKPSVSESRSQDDKDIIRSILKAVILLTPIFGVTWIFGFFILTVDYTQRPMSDIVNYLFTACNAFQGFFILVTACLSEKKVRETLLGKLSWTAKVYKTSTSNASTSRTSNESSLKKK